MIEEIRRSFATLEYEYSLHAVDQSIRRQITRQELEEAVADGEIIEHYPTDKYGPSCLILGSTPAGRSLHIHCTVPGPTRVKIITAYEPDPDEWIEFRSRKKP